MLTMEKQQIHDKLTMPFLRITDWSECFFCLSLSQCFNFFDYSTSQLRDVVFTE